jgi:dihydrofolate reductase
MAEPLAAVVCARRVVRKLIYSMMVSLDGFVETPGRSLDWVLMDEELHSFANEQARELGTFLYGRRLYEVMAAYWPTADADPAAPAYLLDFARIWKGTPKLVFSTTLEQVGWNSTLVKHVDPDEISRLKQQAGSDIDVGGPTLAATFMRLGLIDEYRLLVHPVILGSGTPFFPAMEDRIALQLVETRTFGSGVVYLRYRLRR